MGSRLKKRYETIPPPGHVWNDDGFHYEVVRSKPHTNKDGTHSMLIYWQGQCAECGSMFAFPKPTGAHIYHMDRRCPAHKMGWTRARPYGTPAPAVAPRRLGVRRDERAPAVDNPALHFPKPLARDLIGFTRLALRDDGGMSGRYGSGMQLLEFVWYGSDRMRELRLNDETDFARKRMGSMARTLDEKRDALLLLS